MRLRMAAATLSSLAFILALPAMAQGQGQIQDQTRVETQDSDFVALHAAAVGGDAQA